MVATYNFGSVYNLHCITYAPVRFEVARLNG